MSRMSVTNGVRNNKGTEPAGPRHQHTGLDLGQDAARALRPRPDWRHANGHPALHLHRRRPCLVTAVPDGEIKLLVAWLTPHPRKRRRPPVMEAAAFRSCSGGNKRLLEPR